MFTFVVQLSNFEMLVNFQQLAMYIMERTRLINFLSHNHKGESLLSNLCPFSIQSKKFHFLCEVGINYKIKTHPVDIHFDQSTDIQDYEILQIIVHYFCCHILQDVEKCIEAMKELDGLEIIAAMLVKYPAIIDTLKKVKIVRQHSFFVVLSV